MRFLGGLSDGSRDIEGFSGIKMISILPWLRAMFFYWKASTEIYNICRKRAPSSVKQKKWRDLQSGFPATGTTTDPKCYAIRPAKSFAPWFSTKNCLRDSEKKEIILKYFDFFENIFILHLPNGEKRCFS